MKRLVICVIVLALVLSFCSCGKKTKVKSNTAEEKDNASQSIMIEEDTIDGSISLDDAEDLPELELDGDSVEDKLPDSSSSTPNSSSAIASDNKTSSDTSSKNSGTLIKDNSDTPDEDDGAVEEINDDWGPLT